VFPFLDSKYVGLCNKQLVRLVVVTRTSQVGTQLVPYDSSYLSEANKIIQWNNQDVTFPCENPFLRVLQHAPCSQDNPSDILEITSRWV